MQYAAAQHGANNLPAAYLPDCASGTAFSEYGNEKSRASKCSNNRPIYSLLNNSNALRTRNSLQNPGRDTMIINTFI